MKILLDHCIDWRLKRLLPTHEVRSVQEMGWEEFKNGRLLAAAAAGSLQLMITVDRNLQHEQYLVHLPLAVIVLIADSNRTADLQPIIPFVVRELASLRSGQLM